LVLDCRLKCFTFSKHKSNIQHCLFSEWKGSKVVGVSIRKCFPIGAVTGFPHGAYAIFVVTSWYCLLDAVDEHGPHGARLRKAHQLKKQSAVLRSNAACRLQTMDLRAETSTYFCLSLFHIFSVHSFRHFFLAFMSEQRDWTAGRFLICNLISITPDWSGRAV
jgi:hypothetical protein